MSIAMKIITAPSVYVLARQEIDRGGLQRFLEDVGSPGWTTDTPNDAEAIVEVGGRLCYNSFARPRPGGNEAYIGHILESGHGSVCEHAVWTLLIAGVSRSLSHELIRHRVGISPSQLSQRFYDESDAAFVVPPALIGPVSRTLEALDSRPEPHKGQVYLDRDSWWADDREIGHRWLEACEYSRRIYARLVEWLEKQPGEGDKTLRRKRAREAARSVLPNCVETRLAITLNARAARNFIEQRATEGADAEMARLAVAILKVMKGEAPNLFADFEIGEGDDGREVAVAKYRKV